jgi:hypothetical protein
MSTIRAATLSNIAGTGSPAITGGELSRARYNLNGTGTIAARDSFNVASFTDNGTGDYTATFSTAMPNDGYSVGSTTNSAGVGTALPVAPIASTANQAVGSFRFGAINGSFASVDANYVQGLIVGDIP